MKYFFLFIIHSMCFVNLYAQIEQNFVRCTAVEQEEISNTKLKIDNANKIVDFEKWISKEILKSKNKKNLTSQIYTIPVVFHVLHNGDEIGVNENVSDLQLQSQITRLNQDFRKKINTLGHNENSVGADVEIEFCLAKVDPDGNFTTGIKRHLINKNSLFAYEIEDLKPNYIWDSSNYLNIFTVNFAASANGISLGYAQFPLGAGLPGLTSGMGYNDTINTDSVVLNYMVVGSKTIYPQGVYALNFDEGRTATHEVGHWLGLRHIWGDIDSCIDGSDFCDDTPHHKNFNRGCLNNHAPCTVPEMTENYMDYTNDICLNTFTTDQKLRMRTVLERDARRNYLVTNDKCTYTPNFRKDIGLTNLQILENSCNQVKINLEFSNLGSQNVTTITYQVKINQTVTNYTINQDFLAPSVTNQVVNLSINNGLNIIEVKILSVDGSVDDNLENNIKSKSLQGDFLLANATEINMQLVTDRFPNEINWRFTGPQTNIQNGVLEPSSTHNTVLPLGQSGCYTFTLTDRSGDGICCNFGAGLLKLSINGTQVYNSGTFGSGLTLNFYKETLSTLNLEQQDLYIVPNPSSNVIQIIGFKSFSPIKYAIVNALGQIIVKNKNLNLKEDSIDISFLNQGVYFIQFKIKDKYVNLKFIKK